MKTKLTSLFVVAMIAFAGLSLTPQTASAADAKSCTSSSCCCGDSCSGSSCSCCCK